MQRDPSALRLPQVKARLIQDVTQHVNEAGVDQGGEFKRYLLPSSIRAEALQRLLEIRYLRIRESAINSTHEVLFRCDYNNCDPDELDFWRFLTWPKAMVNVSTVRWASRELVRVACLAVERAEDFGSKFPKLVQAVQLDVPDTSSGANQPPAKAPSGAVSCAAHVPCVGPPPMRSSAGSSSAESVPVKEKPMPPVKAVPPLKSPPLQGKVGP